jgi:hypothetical protein
MKKTVAAQLLMAPGAEGYSIEVQLIEFRVTRKSVLFERRRSVA